MFKNICKYYNECSLLLAIVSTLLFITPFNTLNGNPKLIDSTFQTSAHRLAVLSAMQKWFSHYEQFDNKLPTIIIATSNEQCLGCSAEAINIPMHELRLNNIHANCAVVVRAEFPKEGLQKKKYIRVPIIAEDVDSVLIDIFGYSDQSEPDLYVVLANGSIIFHGVGLQHHSDSIINVVLNLDAFKSRIETLDINHKISLEEKDDCVLSYSKSCTFDSKSEKLTIIDPSNNEIFRYDGLTGRLVKHYSIPDSLGTYFRKPGDNEYHWNSFVSWYHPLVRLNYIIQNQNNSILISTIMYSQRPSAPSKEHPDTVFGFGQEGAFLDIQSDTIYNIHPVASNLSGAHWTAAAEIVPIFHSGYFARNFLSEPSSSVRDSMFLFMRISPDLQSINGILRLADIDKYCGVKYDTSIQFYWDYCLSSNNSNEIYYAENHNNIFMKIILDSANKIRLFEKGGVLISNRNSMNQDSLTTRISDMLALDSMLYIIATQTNKSKKSSAYFLQQYSLDGEYETEKQILTNDGDTIVDVQLAGSSDHKILLLMKEKKKRWQLLTTSL